MVSGISRFDIVLVNLDPTVGSEIRKTRPCLIVSPDEMNRHIRTVIVAPMTTAVRAYPTRVPLRFRRKDGEVALDQIRTIDKSRIVRRVGTADEDVAVKIASALVEMFAMEDR